MSVLLGRGHSGAHVTLIFTVSDSSNDPLEQGSLGAGFCLADGVEAIARGIEGDYSLSVRFIEGNGDSSLYQNVLDLLAKEVESVREHSWEIAIRMKLPPSQGFGMSAAGAVAAAQAFQRALGLPHEDSLRRSYSIAHRIERANSTGLGDVTALSAGGVERRVKPGSPYSGNLLNRGPGKADGWTEHTPMILAWRKTAGKHTSTYIDDPKWKLSISTAGTRQMELLLAGDWDASRWQELLQCSQTFAEESGLLNDSTRHELMQTTKDAIKGIDAERELTPLLCMLGESIAVVPTSLDSDGKALQKLIPELESIGLQACFSKIGSVI